LDRVSPSQKSGIEYFCPGLCLGLYPVYSSLRMVQTGRMLEFMNQYTCRIFRTIQYNGVGTTWIGIATIDMFGFDGFRGERRELSETGRSDEVDANGPFSIEQPQDTPPDLPRNVL
jgi:hypothetical protein